MCPPSPGSCRQLLVCLSATLPPSSAFAPIDRSGGGDRNESRKSDFFFRLFCRFCAERGESLHTTHKKLQVVPSFSCEKLVHNWSESAGTFSSQCFRFCKPTLISGRKKQGKCGGCHFFSTLFYLFIPGRLAGFCGIRNSSSSKER